MSLNSIILRKHMAFIIVTSALSTSLYASSVPISYAKAIQLALANNPKIHAAKASIEAAAGASKQADSMSWPQLGLEVSGARTDNPMSVFGYKLSQGNASFADFGANQYTGLNTLYTKPQALNHPGYYSNLDTAFKLSIPIYSGGRIKAQQAQMRALVASAQRGNQQAQNQLAYEVYASYERFLTANQLVGIAQRQVARARAFLSTTKALKKQSITLESDVLMAEAYLNSSLIGLSNARIQTEDELDSLQLKQIQRAERQTRYELQLSRQTADKEEAVIQKLKQRFGRGLVPLSALLESQMKLTQSKAQELQALHQLRVHEAHWLMLSNQLIPKAIRSA